MKHPCCWLGLLALPILVLPVAAQSGLVIRGRILGVDSLPLQGVEVSLSGAAEVRRATTDSGGRFSAILFQKTGSVFIGLRRIGYQPIGWRRPIAADIQSISIDTIMSPTPITLPEIFSLGQAVGLPRVERQSRIQSGSYNGITPGSMLTDRTGDTEAWLALMTQLTVGDSGVQVLGSAPGQSATTIDGMRSDAGSVPPDALGGAIVMISGTDISQSGFTGPLLNLSTQHGNDNFSSSLRLGYTDPKIAWPDPLSPQQPLRILNGSGFISGPLRQGSAYYRLSFVHSTESTAATDLLHQDPAQLGQWGLSPDTVSRLAATLASLGVITGGPDAARISRSQGSAFLNVDLQPSSLSSLSISLYPSWIRSRAISGGPLSIAGTGRMSALDQWQLIARESTPVLSGINTLKIAASTTSLKAQPGHPGPGGTVMVGITPTELASGTIPLRFGGGASSESSRSNRFELKNEWARSLGSGSHELRVGQSLQIQTARHAGGMEGNCLYQFSSLDQLTVNQPSQYLCTFGGSSASGRTTSAGLYLADTWRASARLGLSGGIRADYQGYGPATAANPLAVASFSLVTGAPASAWTISPRIGFAWEASTKGQGGNWSRIPRSNRLIPAFNMGSGNDLVTTEGTALGAVTLSGTLGAYQGGLDPSRLADEIRMDGGDESTGRLSCLGEAAPIPIWNGSPGGGFCRDGSTPITWSERTRLIHGFTQEYRAPRTWRGGLAVSRVYWNIWNFSAQVLGSINQHRESLVDLNRSLTPQFFLSDENQRPVLVSPADIDPASGLVAPGAARLNHGFGSVMELRSDLQSRGAQLKITASTQRILGIVPLSLSYVLNGQWSQRRGAWMDPEQIAWYGDQVPTHRFLISSQGLRVWWFNLNAQMLVSSGIPFTPVTDRDLNGDGMSGDPAFVVDPARSPDPDLRDGMRRLLSEAPGRIERCLKDQFNRVAAINSCRGAWQTRLDLNLEFDPPLLFGLGERTRVDIRLLNAGAAFSRLLGLAPGTLGGVPSSPDRTLLRVHGFDPSSNRFLYQVNPLFGRSYTNLLAGRNTPPFQLQVTAEVSLGSLRPGGSNLVKYFGLKPDLDADEVRERLRQRLAPDPIAAILSYRDSLGLSSEQFAGLEAIHHQFNSRVDAELQPMVDYIINEGNAVGDAGLLTMTGRMVRTMTELILDARAQAEKLLEEGQLWVLRRLEGSQQGGN